MSSNVGSSLRKYMYEPYLVYTYLYLSIHHGNCIDNVKEEEKKEKTQKEGEFQRHYTQCFI
ncbi:hypothetical protein AK88_05328 [Plasmodium fragile]|uniref:Uncharacterized protein n=1 Tax=Plasmodium fragile TaxID=5857 RepID=A0A0D9QDI6_PLAFR|nr:uncharacterized protein AK88_05328 [Plasmodium fragile]KJP85044.1 hypothetical protein AK88_05328 [Plasmodium fragile]